MYQIRRVFGMTRSLFGQKVPNTSGKCTFSIGQSGSGIAKKCDKDVYWIGQIERAILKVGIKIGRCLRANHNSVEQIKLLRTDRS